jgi:hypothetical protein
VILVKFQQRYEKRHGGLLNPLLAKVLCIGGIPKLSARFRRPILGADLLESRRLSPEICCHDITEPLATNPRSASIVPRSRACWLMAPARRLSPRGCHTTGYALASAFLCRFSYLCWNLTTFRLEPHSPLFSELLFAIVGQSALTVAPNFAINFFSTDRVNSISVLYGQ